MFWHKDKAPKAPAYMNTWYDLSLKALATKISQTIKEDKTYSNIPFGKSLIDVHSDGENTIIAVKTIVDGKQNVQEIHTSPYYIVGYLQPSKLKENWAKSDDQIVLTKENLKQITESISHLIHDSGNSEDSWVFPYYNYTITVNTESVRKYRGRRYISGSAGILDFYGDYGSGGSFSGTIVEDDEILRNSEYKDTMKMGFSLHRCLGSEKLGWSTIFYQNQYDEIKARNQYPVELVL